MFFLQFSDLKDHPLLNSVRFWNIIIITCFCFYWMDVDWLSWICLHIRCCPSEFHLQSFSPISKGPAFLGSANVLSFPLLRGDLAISVSGLANGWLVPLFWKEASYPMLLLNRRSSACLPILAVWIFKNRCLPPAQYRYRFFWHSDYCHRYFDFLRPVSIMESQRKLFSYGTQCNCLTFWFCEFHSSGTVFLANHSYIQIFLHLPWSCCRCMQPGMCFYLRPSQDAKSIK